jgi:hypothetical protein
MRRGIYIMANDRVIDNTIALLNSIRRFDRDVPIALLPYDNRYQKASQLFSVGYGVEVYNNLPMLEQLVANIDQIFGEFFFLRKGQFRKLSLWFGQFDEFLYIDTDIVVFEKIIDTLDYLKDKDFLFCDTQYLDIKSVFKPEYIQKNDLGKDLNHNIFNAGFFGSRKGIFSEQDIYQTLAESKQCLEYFDFSKETSDQPMFNYLVHQHIPRRLNLISPTGKEPATWAGRLGYEERDHRLFDPQLQAFVRFIHWSGYLTTPGCPYWEIWKYYRNLDRSAQDIRLEQWRSRLKPFLTLSNKGEQVLGLLRRPIQEQVIFWQAVGLVRRLNQILNTESKANWDLIEQLSQLRSPLATKPPIALKALANLLDQTKGLVPPLRQPLILTLVARILLAQRGYPTQLRIGVKDNQNAAFIWLEDSQQPIMIKGSVTTSLSYRPLSKEEGIAALPKLAQQFEIKWN